MPCYEPTEADYRHIKETSKLREEAEAIKRKLDERTRILCSVLTKLESEEKIYLAPSDVRNWWVEHKEWDKKRKIQEREDARRRIQQAEADRKAREESIRQKKIRLNKKLDLIIERLSEE